VVSGGARRTRQNLQVHEEDPQKHQPGPELRQRQGAYGQRPDGGIHDTAATHRRDDPGDDASDEAKGQRVESEFDCRRKPGHEVGGDRSAGQVGTPEVTLDQAAEEVQVLHGQRVGQPELLARLLPCLRRGRIADE
jgi:hypothetical protein